MHALKAKTLSLCHGASLMNGTYYLERRGEGREIYGTELPLGVVIICIYNLYRDPSVACLKL